MIRKLKESTGKNIRLRDLDGMIVGRVMIEDFETNEYITEDPMFISEALKQYPILNSRAYVLNIGVYRDAIVWIEVEFS